MNKKIAVIGLGIMGHGIADNFLKKGYEVVLWNRTKQKVDDLLATYSQASFANSPKEATAQADIIFEVTANDESSRQVWLSEDGILAAELDSPKFLITCATLTVKWVEELASQANRPNVTFFDMPMTGSRIGAETGQLTLFTGGDEAALAELKPDLQAIAKDVNYFGPVGSGTKYKLVLNTLQAIHMVGFGEALRLAKSVGLDERQTAETLVERPGGAVTQIAANGYVNELEQVTFSVDWITKDLGYALEMTPTIQHPLLDEVLTAYKRAVDTGHGAEDWTEVNKL